MTAKADEAKCMSQLKTFGQVFSTYAADHDMNIAWVDWSSATFSPAGTRPNPYANYWGLANQQKIKKCRECPANRFPVTNTPSYYFPQLGMNDKMLTTNTPTFKLTAVTHPSQLLLLIDAVPSQLIRFDRKDTCWDTAVKPLCVNTTNPSQIRHSGGVNALFADFHLEHVKWSQLDSSTVQGRENRMKWLTIQ